jgi:hypothetical protein
VLLLLFPLCYIPNPFHLITICRFLLFLCGDHVVFADLGRPLFEVLPRVSDRPEFTMYLRNLATWDRLSENDLTYNNVRPAGSSQPLEELQERLWRKRYIGDAFVNVRPVLLCCRPPDLRCSRYMRRSGAFCNAVRRTTQRLGTHISRTLTQRQLTHRIWIS